MQDYKEDLRRELEQLTTPQLDRMLQETLQQEGDPVQVQLILEVLQEREKDIPLQPDDTALIAWQKYLSRVKESKDKPGKKPNWILRGASVAAILCVLLVAVSHEAGAENFWQRLVRWTDSVIEFFSPENASGGHQEYAFKTENPGLQQVYDTVTGLGVTQPVVPMWLPEGYSLIFCKEMASEKKSNVIAGFQNGEKIVNYNVAVYSEKLQNQFQKDETAAKTIELEGVEYYIIKNNDLWVVVWTIDKIECSISIGCQEDELNRVLRSIYDKEEA